MKRSELKQIIKEVIEESKLIQEGMNYIITLPDHRGKDFDYLLKDMNREGIYPHSWYSDSGELRFDADSSIYKAKSYLDSNGIDYDIDEDYIEDEYDEVEESVKSDVFYYNDGDEAVELSPEDRVTLNVNKDDYDKLKKFVKKLGMKTIFNSSWWDGPEEMFEVSVMAK
jgi:hypothetical protein